MTSPFMEAMASALAAGGIAIHRFEFAYMAARRTDGKRRPPPRAEALADEYRQAVAEASRLVPAGGALLIGGKSLGGRVASLVADELFAAGRIAGLVCLGYPFHPPGKPGVLRAAHLEQLACPALIVQGERDPFGTRAEVEALHLSHAIELVWAADGDHDFGPRGRSGSTRAGNMATAAAAVVRLAARVG